MNNTAGHRLAEEPFPPGYVIWFKINASVDSCLDTCYGAAAGTAEVSDLNLHPTETPALKRLATANIRAAS